MYQNIGTGECIASDGGLLDRYYGDADQSACENLCSANPECLGYDIYDIEKCHLFVSDGNSFGSGTPTGFTQYFSYDGTDIVSASHQTFPVGCMRKILGKHNIMIS